MDWSDVVSALGLPNEAKVDQRVPKKLLLENAPRTTADKRLIVDTIEGIRWLAALKPSTIGVPDYRDTEIEYLEIAVLAVTLRGFVKPGSLSRLAELVHRAVPYPVLLLMVDGPTLIMSLAHKRWAQNEVGKIVLEGDKVTASLTQSADCAPRTHVDAPCEIELSFKQSIAISRQPQTSIYALYQGWIECVQALDAARRTGVYRIVESPEQAGVRRHALADCHRLEVEISRLRVQARKEKQLARQVEINLMLRLLEAELAATQQQL